MRQWWVVPGPDGAVPELRTVESPTAGPGQVVVDVAGAGINRGELIGGRLLRSDNPAARPAPSGIEAAGTVVEVGAGVQGWSIGDRVMARGRACHADRVVVDAEALLASPTSLDDIEASAIPNVFVTAHDALVTAAGVGPDDVVMVTAGPSGVGTAAIQIARHLGATVVATTRSAGKAATLSDLGAHLVVDTTRDNWVSHVIDEVGTVSCVIDQVGGDLFPTLLDSLGVGGRYVSVGRNAGPTSTIDLDLLARQRLTLIGVTFRTRTREESIECSRRFASDLLHLFDSGELRPVIDRTFPLDELSAAHSYMRTDSGVGKVLLVP